MNGTAIQQLYQQGVQLAQAGWMYECTGNPAAAGAHYQQALGTLDACGRIPGVQPVDRLYWMGSCQVRMGYLCHAAGNFAWAQGWFGLVQQSLAAVCRCDPHNPTYQGLFRQVQQVKETKPGEGLLGLLKKGLGMLPDLLESFNKSDASAPNAPSAPAAGNDWMNQLLGGGGGMVGGDGGMMNWMGGDGSGGYGWGGNTY